MNKKGRYVEIDSIRGLTAIIILVHHYTKYIYNVDGQSDWFLNFIEYGKYTVHAFFIISGFLIFMTLEKSKKPAHFIVSRFSRLYPAYWACIGLTVLVITFSPFYNGPPVTSTQLFANLTMFQHWMFIEDIDGVYWTLAVEMCFYFLIFSVFLFRQQKNIERIGIGWSLLMALLYALMKQHLLPSVNYYYFVPLLRNGNLFFGGILFYKLKNNPENKKKYILLILLTLAVHFIINSAEESIAITLIYTVLYLFVIDRLKILRNGITYFLGFISYPLYLLHQYIGYEIINYFDNLGMRNIFLRIIIPALLIIGLASAVTYLVEQPAMKFLRKKLLPAGDKQKIGKGIETVLQN